MLIALSVIYGTIISGINIYLLKKVADNIMMGAGKRRAVFTWLVKFALLAVFIWLGVGPMHLQPIFLLIGLTIPIVLAIIYATFWGFKVSGRT